MISAISNHPSRRRKAIFLAAATAVLLLAAAFRLVALDIVPPGLSQDEVLNADIVQLIRQGEHALFFREGFGHEPLYHYWSVPFQILLGDNLLSIRLPALFLGLLLVAATIRWAQRDFGSLPAISAGMGLAISWWPIIFSRVGLRPILEPLLLVAAAWFWPKRPWASALLLGISFYSYTGARVLFLLPPAVAAVQLLFAANRAERLVIIRRMALMLAILALLYAPLYITFRADPGLQQRVLQLEGPLAALQQGDWRPVWAATWATMGVFSRAGDPRWTYMLPGVPLFDWVTAILFYTGLLLILYRIRRAQAQFLLVWFAVTLLPSALTPQAPSTVRLIGALPVVYLFPGVTLAFLYRWGRDRAAAWGRPNWWQAPFALVLMLLAVVNGGRTVQNGFYQWAGAVETRVDHYQAFYSGINQFLKREDGNDFSQPLIVADAFVEPIDVSSLRRTLGVAVDTRWVEAAGGKTGAFVWPGGENEGLLFVPEYAPLSTALRRWLSLEGELVVGESTVPAFTVFSVPQPPPISGLEQPVRFEDQMTLTAYEFIPADDSGTLLLVTLWQVDAPLPWNLTAFVHLVDEEGEIVAQHDGFDAAPFQLQPGDRIAQLHPLPGGLPSGLQVHLGLYLPDTGSRLQPEGTEGDRLILIESLMLTE